MRTNIKGFTLIELIVVIGIIAILSSVVALNFTDIFDNARTQSNDATIHTVQKSLEISQAELGESFDVTNNIHIQELNDNLENIIFDAGNPASAEYDSVLEIQIDSDLEINIVTPWVRGGSYEITYK